MVALVWITNIVGNLCTLLSFKIDPKLRTVPNYYILNLAVTDLIIGLSSLPFYAVYTVLDFYWPFGYNFCKAWSVIDFWVCAESAATICLISWDRLQMVRKGAQYANYSTPRRAYVLIGVTWLLTGVLYTPAIVAFDIWRGYRTVEEDDCDVEFATDFWYTLITAILEFLVPFTAVSAFSALLYKAIRQRSRKVAAMGATTTNTNGSTSSGSSAHTKITTVSGESVPQKPSNAVCTSGVSPAVPSTENKPSSKHFEVDKREKKALKSLSALVIAFLVCWTPYTVATILLALCEDCINEDLYEFFNWLLWANSSLNALMYAYTNDRFRQNYKRILTWQLCCPRREEGRGGGPSKRTTRVAPVNVPQNSSE